MRCIIITCLSSLSLLVVLPASARPPTRAALQTYSALYHRVADAHGKRAPGRNIRRWDVRTRGGTRPATAREISRSIAVLRRQLAPALAAGPIAFAAPVAVFAQTPSAGGSCGAGHRGLYQFDCQTWQSVGGSGDPAQASPAEQRRRAEILQRQRGNQPWPVCGQGGASLDQIAKCESGGDPTAVG